MRFGKRFRSLMIQEWQDKYMDYKNLKSQVRTVREGALELAQSYSKIKELTGEEINELKINLRDIKGLQEFNDMLLENVDLVETWYLEKVNEMANQFESLVLQMIMLGLIEKYVPLQEGGGYTRLERQLQRLGSGIKLDAKTPIVRIVSRGKLDNFLKPLGIKDVLPDERAKYSPKQVQYEMSEVYRGLVLLAKYCDVNLAGFQKILKKHDKNIGGTLSQDFRNNILKKKDFYHKSHITYLKTEIEKVYAMAFTEGRRTQAMDQLRVPTEKPKVGMSNWRLGLNIGVTIPLICLLIYFGFTTDASGHHEFDSVIIVYRMLGMANLMIWFWGFNMYIWTRFRVNYVFIIEFNPREHIRYQHMMEAASLFTIIWFLSLFFYLLSNIEPEGFVWLADIPWQVHPLMMLFFSTVAFLGYQIKSRFWLVNTLARIVRAPFATVTFKDFFLADQLNSIVIVLFDLEYTLCFFLSDAWTGQDQCFAANVWIRPMIAFMPALWRFLQCLRRYRDSKDVFQLLNAGKYSTGFFVVIFSSVRHFHASLLGLWILCVTISTFYTYSWDVYMDWGLARKENRYLRQRLIYPRYFYYFAMVTNLVMRFMWCLTISPESLGIRPNLVFATVLAAVEITRRAQWNIFRLENEQLNNVGKFKTTNVSIPLPKSVERVDSIDDEEYMEEEAKKLQQQYCI